ncbi:xanthine dehydrogenase family protein molybdopterin-binding subunit [Saccharopolyspora rhizosphaerae]|uniref:Xanthine dehydrogenase family protein molybdopterin-binding subunit n=1 Tax=Saccharopolyspora rhizosphaerae TaxID=2492662 RepID=A0A426JI72_9PSEU|nr:molybdopterin cofactor-binding domain-containing protein [Saccharopolyspora rhizosphaerae]RRO12894.1 xanthine dehydrogenase family protein molybdopterin-binding subunit [Saccharopolyspora rhizosphaerae]
MVPPTTDHEEAAAPASGTRRRRFLTYVAAAPMLTIAGKFVLEGDAAAAAGPVADQLPLPPVSGLMDFGDLMEIASAPTMELMKLEFTSDNKVRFELPRLEVGQGLNTAIVMMLAEELGARTNDVVVELSDARPELLFNQFTAASSSVRTFWKPLRQMAATARSRLVTAAAKKWGVSANGLTTQGTGVVGPGGRKATFADLAKDAAKVGLPSVPATPKKPSEFKVLGKGQTRADANAIVTGRARYVSDMKIPGSVVAVVVRPPTLSGEVESYDDSAIRNARGFKGTVELDSGVAVCAEYTWEAMELAKKLEVTWKSGPISDKSSSDIQEELAGMTGSLDDSVSDSDGDEIDESFDFAFVSHAPMEVNYAVADVKDGSAEIWVPAQSPQVAQKDIAAALGILDVKVHVTRAGGSFGRHLFHDAAIEAAEVSKAIGKPVKLLWTRNDDTRHGRMRPASHHRVKASFRSGKVRSWAHKMSSVATDFNHGIADMITSTAVQSGVGKLPAAQLYFNLTQSVPYEFGATTISLNDLDLDGVHTGSWRSVHSATFRTAEDLVIDQIAEKAGTDAANFRVENAKSERAKAVLKKVMKDGNWGRSMPQGHAQGISMHEEFKSVAACLVEINATDPKNPRVTKAVIAVDAGLPLNPKGIEAQMMGGLTDAISTVLQAGIHIDNGAVREGSFSDFRWARQRHTPKQLQIHVMPATTDEPGGVGELGVPVCAGAIATAYARATGTKPRSFPVNH